jgi:hypothetical protein
VLTKHAGVAQQNGFGPAFLQYLEILKLDHIFLRKRIEPSVIVKSLIQKFLTMLHGQPMAG